MPNNAAQVVSKTSSSVTINIYSNHADGPEAEDAPFSVAIFGRLAEGGGGAVHFDGATWISTSLGLGLSNAASGSISVWINPASPLDVSFETIIADYVTASGSDSDLIVNFVGSGGSPANTLRPNWANGVNGIGQTLTSGQATSASTITAAMWINILMAWDCTITSSPMATVYFNDAAKALVDFGISGTGFEVQLASILGWAIGAQYYEDSGAQSFFTGDMYDLWFAPDQYIDFSIEANRRKFIDADGAPVDLGANGNLPTGTAPAIFLHGGASSFATNQGTAGDIFAVTGTLTDATAPS